MNELGLLIGLNKSGSFLDEAALFVVIVIFIKKEKETVFLMRNFGAK